MDQSAPWTVAVGTIVTSTTSAIGVGVYTAVVGRPNAGILASLAALNSGITAATFFGIREFVVSPILVHVAPWPQYVRRRRELGIDKTLEVLSPTETKRSFSGMQTSKLIDSGISGALAGGLLRRWRAGPRGVLPGAIFASVVCTALQFGYNQAIIARLKYVSKIQEAELFPASNTPALKPNLPEEARSEVPFAQRLLRLLAFAEISDEEYLAKLRLAREKYEKRISELEREINE